MSKLNGEKRLWKMNLLILRKSLPILLSLAGLICVVFPLSFFPDLVDGKIENATTKCIMMIHGLFVLGVLLPCLAILPSWMEENSREILHASAQKKRPCFILLQWILRFYMAIVTVPITAACILMHLSLLELLRLIFELLYILGLFYLFLMVLQSALLGAMVSTLYALFSILYCRSEETQVFCIIRPDLLYYEGFFKAEGISLFIAAMICWAVAFWIEGKKTKINV